MRDEDVIALVITLVVAAVFLTVYVALIVLGVNIAKRKNRSPHWMWFAIHPVGLIITLIVMACLSPLRKCPRCTQKMPGNAYLCGYCGYSFSTPEFMPPPQQNIYMPPPRY
ncbi:MAG TPA: zinc ribbon domain-containing protein [Pyrinomonadaceae bacterium]|nr:zinc ribbon domain-containing protein [Pyrinomonadaceae bacterium]